MSNFYQNNQIAQHNPEKRVLDSLVVLTGLQELTALLQGIARKVP